MEEGCAYFVLLVHVLMMSLLLTDVSCICDRPCSSPDLAWANRCQISAPYPGCGYIPETGDAPSAPRNLGFKKYLFSVQDATTLALNITWQLPENVTGLVGFHVHVIKASYPVGYQDCKEVTFPALSETPGNPPEVTFFADCFNNVDVDGLYDVTVTSLPSGQSIKKRHHTWNCQAEPSVSKCLELRGCTDSPDSCTALATPDDWRAQSPDAQAVFEDHTWKVRVTFDVYPGDLWLDYRVNLYSFQVHRTPEGFSDNVNSNGSSRPITYEFRDVPPGTYKVTVKIKTGDAIMVSSNNVTVKEPTQPPVTTKGTVRLPTTAPALLDEGSKTEADINTPVIVGVGVGIGVAVCFLAGLVIWTWQKRQRGNTARSSVADGASGGMPRPDDTSNLVNNMAHSEVDKVVVKSTDGQHRPNNSNYYHGEWNDYDGNNFQGCGNSYLQGSLFTDFSDPGCVHMVGSIDPDLLTDMIPIQDGSVVSV